ncbi:hypothetical protein N9230_01965 [Akkermansiaceae bacterium]|nr:hypothetical protein [Akkermansiaceae bacterium]
MERSLFGSVFQRKKINRQNVEVRFGTSHDKEDGYPRNELILSSGEQTLALGLSLKEDELLWLERELSTALGQPRAKDPADIAEEILREKERTVANSELDQDFQSKTLRFVTTMHGWDAEYRYGWRTGLSVILFGIAFLIVGLIIPSIGNTNDFGDFLFAALFALIGTLGVLGGIGTLGFRMNLTLKHSRFYLSKKCFGIGTSYSNEKTRISHLEVSHSVEVSHSGYSNDQPCYNLRAVINSGKRIILLRGANGKDAGQLKARLEAELPSA